MVWWWDMILILYALNIWLNEFKERDDEDHDWGFWTFVSKETKVLKGMMVIDTFFSKVPWKEIMEILNGLKWMVWYWRILLVSSWGYLRNLSFLWCLLIFLMDFCWMLSYEKWLLFHEINLILGRIWMNVSRSCLVVYDVVSPFSR